MTTAERLAEAMAHIQEARSLVAGLQLAGHWQHGLGLGAGQALERAEKHIDALANIHAQTEREAA